MPILRRYTSEDDYWKIRQFLRGVYLANDRRERAWQPYRLDYWRWHVNENIFKQRLEDVVFLWEMTDGSLVAVMTPESPGEAYLHVHPHFATPVLIGEMLDVAEHALSKTDANGRRSLAVFANEHESVQQQMLADRGFIKGDWPEFLRRRPLTAPIAAVPLAPGYTVRALGDESELPRRSWVSWRAFHPNEPDDKYAQDGGAWYRNVQRCPQYRRDLDLVAVAPDGTFAAFTTLWFDDVTRTGSLEPVGTAPEHQRRGLARAVITEGLRRLQYYGATQATVGCYSAEACELYAALGFTEYEMGLRWVKTEMTEIG